VVVNPYRVIALYRRDGSPEVLAIDPAESAQVADQLVAPSRSLAEGISTTRAGTVAHSVAQVGDKSFLLYAIPVRQGGAIVVATDIAMLLHAVSWMPPPLARLYVTDPAGQIWEGCETAAGCHPAAPEPPPRRGRRAAILFSETVQRPAGTWTVTWRASSEGIMAIERSLILRIIISAVAAAIAVAGVGAFVLRHQRRAVTLEGRLRYSQALAAARETSQSIVEHAPIGVLGVSHDGRVALANSFLTERLGPIGVGAPLGEAFARDGRPFIDELVPLLLREDPVDEVRAVVVGAHQLHVRIVPVHNRALGVRSFALVEDQSALRTLENQLVRAEKLITLGVLSAGIAHEIGTPLAVIRGRAQQVLRFVGGGAGAEDLRVIIKHIDQISSTIRQLLDFSRRQPIERQAVALEPVIERARGLLQWKLDAKSLRLRVELESELPALAADPDQLEQVLVNLLLNACDASRADQEVVLTGRRARDGQVAVEIADRGMGIRAEHMNAVFDPFFTTKKRGEGTGLGLPIVASIVRNHSGEINLSSVERAGTTVTVLWPAMPDAGALSA
jgi:signal transduction histidine kinase